MPAADMPVPPPFMWACRGCADLLTDLATAVALTREYDVHDGAARCQLMLSSHLATEHPGEIPEAHEDCPVCAHFREWAGKQGAEDLWAEHLARDLFLPADVARLM